VTGSMTVQVGRARFGLGGRLASAGEGTAETLTVTSQNLDGNTIALCGQRAVVCSPASDAAATTDGNLLPWAFGGFFNQGLAQLRSEERRVGKECRSGGAPDEPQKIDRSHE